MNELGHRSSASADGAGISGETPPSVRIVEAVAASTGRDATELPPLHDYVDADAIDALLGPGGAGSAEEVHLSFTYDDVQITVQGDGAVEVED